MNRVCDVYFILFTWLIIFHSISFSSIWVFHCFNIYWTLRVNICKMTSRALCSEHQMVCAFTATHWHKHRQTMLISKEKKLWQDKLAFSDYIWQHYKPCHTQRLLKRKRCQMKTVHLIINWPCLLIQHTDAQMYPCCVAPSYDLPSVNIILLRTQLHWKHRQLYATIIASFAEEMENLFDFLELSNNKKKLPKFWVIRFYMIG